MEKLNKKLQAQLNYMLGLGPLFRTEARGEDIWNQYLLHFGEGMDPIYRDPQSSTHNCNFCKNFIRRYGNLVAINEKYELVSLFGFNADDPEYDPSLKAMDEFVRGNMIEDAFFESLHMLEKMKYEDSVHSSLQKFRLGRPKNVKRYTQEEADLYPLAGIKANDTKTFHHFSIEIPAQYVLDGPSVESKQGSFRDKYQVFKRGLLTIPMDTLNLVEDLIHQGSLLDGTAHLGMLKAFKQQKKEFDKLPGNEVLRDNWMWLKSYKITESTATFRNRLIGVLCVELAEGEDVNKACTNWNKRVDPANYHKATAPITRRQIEEAEKFIQENGYAESFDRRIANIDDIRATEIKHLNAGDGKIQTLGVLDGIKPSSRHKRNEFKNIEEVPIEKFMKDILPNCTQVEAYLENRMEKNMAVLTMGAGVGQKPIFKWDNNFSWTYNGNLAGVSQIKEAVKSRGGKVEGIMRISLHFPETKDDYDLHLQEPAGGTHICYSNVRRKSLYGGMLDLDAQGVDGHQPPEKRVENIIYADDSKMVNGDYKVKVNNYSMRRFPAKFKLEVELDGDMTVIELKNTGEVTNTQPCIIRYENGSFDLKVGNSMKVIDSQIVSTEIWSLDSNQFHKVNLVCLSPNHWDSQVGNLHYFFMLDNCKADGKIRGFHNENLNDDLLKHRKVMEVLGSTKMIEPNGKQLAGLGFNSTVKDELVVRCSGNFKRTLKIKF